MPSDHVARLMSYVVKTDGGCWEWRGGRTPSGYGMFWYEGATRRAHRVSYALLVGPIPDGLTIDHLCRNRACVNPDHLEPVTGPENTRRADPILRGAHWRKRTHCSRGHEYPADPPRQRNGTRICVECNRIHRANYRRRKGVREWDEWCKVRRKEVQ